MPVSERQHQTDSVFDDKLIPPTATVRSQHLVMKERRYHGGAERTPWVL